MPMPMQMQILLEISASAWAALWQMRHEPLLAHRCEPRLTHEQRLLKQHHEQSLLKMMQSLLKTCPPA